MARSTIWVAVVSVAVGLSTPAMAQQKYTPWQDPDAVKQSAGQLQGFVDDLNKLVNDAERSRAADPNFLRDLRDLTRRYDRPWQVTLLDERFTDGDFTKNPTWTVSQGRFFIERGYGLRGSGVAAAGNAATPEPAPRRQEDVAVQICGAILNQALGGGQGGNQSSTASKPAETRAVISTAARITNAFSLRMEFTSWKSEGQLEIGPYQGEGRAAGYRLVYRSAGSPSLELRRTSGRGSSVIGTATASVKLEDQKPHNLEWTRDTLGKMVVRIDGKEVLRADDRGYRDPFDGFQLINAGGDYILSRITVEGTR
jgi:hypothetical protein